MPLVLASRNPGKIRELTAILAPLEIPVLAVDAFPDARIPLEATGPRATFYDNALLKARTAYEDSGYPALGDDSGLVVDALFGAPGVDSAYFAGPDADDDANNAELVRRLADVPEGPARSCRYVCTLVLVYGPGDDDVLVAEGRLGGRVIDAPRGRGGFGYDPHVLLTEHGVTVAELDPADKNALSHRGRAWMALADRLQAMMLDNHEFAERLRE